MEPRNPDFRKARKMGRAGIYPTIFMCSKILALVLDNTLCVSLASAKPHAANKRHANAHAATEEQLRPRAASQMIPNKR
jgi:hypothetical protein